MQVSTPKMMKTRSKCPLISIPATRARQAVNERLGIVIARTSAMKPPFLISIPLEPALILVVHFPESRIDHLQRAERLVLVLLDDMRRHGERSPYEEERRPERRVLESEVDEYGPADAVDVPVYPLTFRQDRFYPIEFHHRIPFYAGFCEQLAEDLRPRILVHNRMSETGYLLAPFDRVFHIFVYPIE